jgi:calmodulin-regulated spectrin-associated protein
VYVSEPADCALTETVLIQTSPLRMPAHLAVIEALMMLFMRELAPPSRVLSAVQRYSKTEEVPADSEEALIFWVNQSCQAVRYKQGFDNNRVSDPDPRWIRIQKKELHRPK